MPPHAWCSRRGGRNTQPHSSVNCISCKFRWGSSYGCVLWCTAALMVLHHLILPPVHRRRCTSASSVCCDVDTDRAVNETPHTWRPRLPGSGCTRMERIAGTISLLSGLHHHCGCFAQRRRVGYRRPGRTAILPPRKVVRCPYPFTVLMLGDKLIFS